MNPPFINQKNPPPQANVTKNPPSYIQSLRARVGTRRIFLAFTSIILRDHRDRILLQYRTDFECWGLPGGVLEPGEDLQTCARRELREETGLQAGPLTLTGVYSEPELGFTYPNGDQVQQYTVCVEGQMSGGRLHPDGIESSQVEFFEPEDLPWDSLPPWYAAMLHDSLSGQIPAYAPPTASRTLAPQICSLRTSLGEMPFIAVGAKSVIVRPDGRILAVRPRRASCWRLPGGYSQLGENAAQTAVRTALAATGLPSEPVRLLGIYSPRQAHLHPHGGLIQPVFAIFRLRTTQAATSSGSRASQEAAWLLPEDLHALPANPADIPLHTAILAHLDRGVFLLP